MGILLAFLRPIIPIILEKESRTGVFLIVVAILFGYFLVSYVDKKHDEVKNEMHSMSSEFKSALLDQNKSITTQNDLMLDEIRSVRDQIDEVQRDVLKIYRDQVTKKHNKGNTDARITRSFGGM